MRYLIFLLIIASCTTAKKVPVKLDKLNSKFPGTVAAWVAEEYPLLEVSSDTVKTLEYIVIECGDIYDPVEEDTPFLIEIDDDKKGVKNKNGAAKPSDNKVKLKPGESVSIPSTQTNITTTKKSSAEVTACEENVISITKAKDKEIRKERMLKNIFVGLSIALAILSAILLFLTRRKTIIENAVN